MSPAELDATGTALAMIHSGGGQQLLITAGRSHQDLEQALTALRGAGIDPVRVRNDVITIEYDRGLSEKKVISALATVLREAGFQPALPGRGRRTWRPL